MKKNNLKEFKKEDIQKFKNTKRGNKVYPTLSKLFIDGILCFLCSIILIITTILFKDGIIFYIMAGILLLFGIYFIYISNNLKRYEIARMKTSEKKKDKSKDD